VTIEQRPEKGRKQTMSYLEEKHSNPGNSKGKGPEDVFLKWSHEK
jgi:hypothetical protein